MSRAFVNVLGVAICLAYSGSFVIVKSECRFNGVVCGLVGLLLGFLLLRITQQPMTKNSADPASMLPPKICGSISPADMMGVSSSVCTVCSRPITAKVSAEKNEMEAQVTAKFWRCILERDPLLVVG